MSGERGSRRVQFSPTTTFYIVEGEEWKIYRKDNWTSFTADRYRFLERVKIFESILMPQIKNKENGR